MKEEKAIVTFQCSEELKHQMRIEAARDNQTTSAYIRTVVEEAMARAAASREQGEKTQ